MANWRVEEEIFPQPVGFAGRTGLIVGFVGNGDEEECVVVARTKTEGAPDIEMWPPNKPDLAKARDCAELLAEFVRVVERA